MAFPDEASCLQYIFYHCHGFFPRCPRCRKPASFTLVRYRRSFLSRCCGGFLSPTAKTILDHTRIPLRMWFYALLLYSDLKVGLSQNSLMRLLGISRNHAWAMADKLRTHIALSAPDEALGGAGQPVYVDEAQVWIGPSRQRHVLLGICDGKRCVIRIVEDRSAASLLPPVIQTVLPGSIVVTDGWYAYSGLEQHGFRHSRVIHNRKMWVNAEGYSMTYVEGIWAVLKRMLKGKSAQVAPANLWKFVAEVAYRYNAGLDPAGAYWGLLGSFRALSPDCITAARLQIDRRGAVCRDSGREPIGV